LKRLIFVVLYVVVLSVLFSVSPACAIHISLNRTLDKISLGLEQAIGLSGSQQLAEDKGLVTDAKVNERVNDIAGRLLPFVNRKKIQYHLAVLNDSDFNACALPGGYILINEGLLENVRSDGELAYVIAHEITHVDERHGLKQLTKLAGLSVVGKLLGKKVSDSDVARMGAQAIMASYSRQDEKESDLKGVALMVKAGFDPAYALTAMRRMETLQREKPDLINQLFATHPAPVDRSEYLKDYALNYRYGRDFRGAEIGRLIKYPSVTGRTSGLPIIIAHPSLWETPLTASRVIDCVGIFNPSSDEDKDVKFYLDILRSGQFVGVVCDNDGHDPVPTEGGGEGTSHRYTFVEVDLDRTLVDAPDVAKERLLQAIKEGRSYASVDGAEIQAENFRIGADYTVVSKAAFQFKLVFSKEVKPAPKMLVYRDGQKIVELSPKGAVGSKPIKEVQYRLDDERATTGLHWYVFYMPGKLITSPITINLTRNKDEAAIVGSDDWHKGIVHYHSTYSDGSSSVRTIWEKAREQGVEFVFMTDHADCFGEGKGWHQKELPGYWDNITGIKHLHPDNNPYDNLVNECQELSSLGWPIPLMVAGVEYPLTDYRQKRHLLVLGLQDFLPYYPMNEYEFFSVLKRDTFLLEPGPIHLGDDTPDSQTVWLRQFELYPEDLEGRSMAVVRLQVKATPRKDPIISFNRVKVGAAITRQTDWEQFEFRFNSNILRSGNNLIDLETIIPDLYQTFDDCEIQNIKLTLK